MEKGKLKIYLKKLVACHLSLISSQNGQSLIEIIIAISLASLLLPALATGLISSREGKAQESQRLQATTLLRETNEAVRSVREKGWINIAANNTYHPEIDTPTSTWKLVPGSEQISGFNRQIIISDAQRDSNGNIVESGGTTDTSTKKIVSTVSWTTPIPSSVDSTSYLQRYLGNNAFTHTSETNFNGGVHNNTQVIPTGDGAVELVQSPSSNIDWGNKFRVESTSAIGNMTNSTMKTSLRFTIQSAKTVNAIRVYLQNEAGTSPSYRYGIQTDSGGIPSGSFLGSGTLTATSTGWKTITLSPSVNLTAGMTYHIVVQYASGTISTSRYIALRRSSPLNALYAYNNNPDMSANTLFNSGSSWTIQNYQPLYELDFSDSTYEGNPYETSAGVTIRGANWIGERFTVTQGDKTVNNISFFIRQNSTTEPLDSLQVELRTVSPNAVVSGGSGVLATAAQTTTTYAYFTYTFASPITLTNGTAYRIILKSPGSNSTNYYQVYRIVTTNAANYTSISYDGENSIYTVSANSGSSWTDTSYWDIGGYYFQVQGTNQYSASGDFTSHASGSFDGGGNVAFNNITWTANVPVNTTLRFQIAINTDGSTWNFFGPDGTGSSFYGTPGSIPLPFINGRYIRYKALFTGDGTTTPTLNDVSINYSP